MRGWGDEGMCDVGYHVCSYYTRRAYFGGQSDCSCS